MDKRTSDIIQQILTVAAEMGLQGKYKLLSEELNRRGITSPRGAEWSPQGLSNIYRRHKLFGGKEESLSIASAPQDTTPEQQAEPKKQNGATQDTADIPQPEAHLPETSRLDPETIVVLRDVALWWTTRGAEMAWRGETLDIEPSKPAYRPSFPGKRKNTGIRVNARLLQDALEKAQTPEESIRTGRGLTPLIEYLLWGYLGFDPKYLQT